MGILEAAAAASASAAIPVRDAGGIHKRLRNIILLCVTAPAGVSHYL